jgi:hypothetical protein
MSIYDANIANEYGVSPIQGNGPIAVRPQPTGADYTSGSITRWFAMKVNAPKAVEIDSAQSDSINTDLYAVVSLMWKISGPRNALVVNGVIEKAGVYQENLNAIAQVKAESGVDLSKTLTNPLELWRGY